MIGSLMLAVQLGTAAENSARASIYFTSTIQDTIGQPQKRRQTTKKKSNADNSAKETTQTVVEKVVKTVPKARNQQVPRPVIPQINQVGPKVKVKVKTKVNTKIRIKL